MQANPETQTTMTFQIRPALAGDKEAILALMPRLAAFDVPESRKPEDLWRSDAKLMLRCLEGKADGCFAQVAVDESQKVIGLSLVSMRPELLSHDPSAHLEAIAVSETAEGTGVGKALLAAAEREAKARGARSITLHVFASNSHARDFYRRSGYQGELLRYIKNFSV
jgi:ribosomal protein S18 acetylase RimI-like enzyme